jgi:hypothetical protein
VALDNETKTALVEQYKDLQQQMKDLGPFTWDNLHEACTLRDAMRAIADQLAEDQDGDAADDQDGD